MLGLFKPKPPAQKSQRVCRRHQGNGAEVVIAGCSYALHNWSHGGVQIIRRNGNFILGQQLGMTLRFRKDTSNPLETVLQGKVLRLESERVSIGFCAEPGAGSLRCFRQVVDFDAAKKFAG